MAIPAAASQPKYTSAYHNERLTTYFKRFVENGKAPKYIDRLRSIVSVSLELDRSRISFHESNSPPSYYRLLPETVEAIREHLNYDQRSSMYLAVVTKALLPLAAHMVRGAVRILPDMSKLGLPLDKPFMTEVINFIMKVEEKYEEMLEAEEEADLDADDEIDAGEEKSFVLKFSVEELDPIKNWASHKEFHATLEFVAIQTLKLHEKNPYFFKFLDATLKNT
jgi:hypothetical protein